MNSVNRRVLFGTSVFSFFGLLGTIVLVDNWVVSLPLILTYAVLVYDTFFSVRYFSAITPVNDSVQNFFDLILIISYGLIALNLNNPLGFMASTSGMFLIATGKYIVLRQRIGGSTILSRKVHIDILGAVGYGLCTVPIFFGWIWQASWVLFIAYTMVNIQILWRNPLYPYTKPANQENT